MFLFTVTLLFAILGALLTLLTAAVIGLYTSPVPGGSNAVGLVIPFFTAIGAGLAGMIAGVVMASRGGLDWMNIPRPTTLPLILIASLLIGVSILVSFLGWAERDRFANPGLLNLTGVLLPLCYFGFVFVSVWSPPTAAGPSTWARLLGFMTLAGVASGTVAGCLCVQALLAKQARLQAYRLEDDMKAKQEQNRREELSPEKRLLEDLSKYSDTAPLWTLTSALPTETNPSLRAIWIQRALRVPDLESEMSQTLGGKYGRFRHGCAAMIREVPEPSLQPKRWPTLLAEDARLTADDIRQFQDLAEHDNDLLGQHVIAIAAASRRFAPSEQLNTSLTLLRDAVAGVGPSPERTTVLKELESAIAWQVASDRRAKGGKP
jgi:hypothetical protein